MSDIGLIEDSARRVIADDLTNAVIEASEQGTWAGALWDNLEKQGLLQPAAIAEGSDAGEVLEMEAAVVRAAAETATPLPVAETAVAGWFLARSGIEVPSGVLSLALFTNTDKLSLADGRVRGRLDRVPWARNAIGIVAVADRKLVLMDPCGSKITHGLNMAGEPRDAVEFDSATPIAVGGTANIEQMLCRCAAVRALQLAEASARVLEMTVDYAGQRKQFGKPIGGFQAIQHQLAAAASEVASARVAAQQARLALATQNNVLFACGIAKARANDAGGAVARASHQVHGAIGFTREYALHRFTRRIQAWRAEYGSSAFWNRRVGELILKSKGSVWSIISAEG
jgi:acyl-CoA dehydrogenase